MTILNKKILMIIAFNGFKDEEFFVPKEIFEQAGFEVATASTQTGIAQGSDGGEIEVKINLGMCRGTFLRKFTAVIFIGGGGMAQNLDNLQFQQLAQEAVNQGKILGAICIAPALLAKAGVLQDKNATVWSSVLDKSAVKILRDTGADFQDESVVVDANIITANGPAAGREFAEKIIDAIVK